MAHVCWKWCLGGIQARFWRPWGSILVSLALHFQEFGDDFKVVAIFNSSVKNLKRYATRHNAPFPILADEKYHYFKKYEVQKSLFVFLISQFTRVFQIWTAMFKGFIPYTLNGYVGILPVDILINQDGTVENVHYGKDIGDHLPLSDIINFSN